ncbi:MAG: GatB/YqeY domain-containing protein [Bacteroidota bacterium]|nr:GatB/YqeY domain-containing protein [Bacteroidota bacterium]
MTLFDKINDDIKHAMLNKEPKDKLEALRAIKAAFLLAKTEKAGVELTEDAELKIITKLVKQRRESAEIYKEQNRPELAEKELIEVAVMEAYLPAQMSVEDIEAVVKAAIEKTGAKTPSDMGKVMGVASKELAGKAEGKTISEIVKRLLAS